MAETLEPGVGAAIASPNAGEIVELFTLDATAIGSELFAFASAPVLGADGERVPPRFGGQTYGVAPITSTGWEWSGDGPMPQPRVTVTFARPDGDLASLGSLLLGALVVYGDLLGAVVTRLRTFRPYLDDGDDPNPNAHLGLERFVIEQKVEQGPTSVEFRLRAAIDQEAVRLPRRRAFDRCQWRYRVHDGAGGFDYSAATCPYAGPATFDAKGDAVEAAALDVCGKNISDCKLRFGANAELPFGGFPAVGRITI